MNLPLKTTVYVVAGKNLHGNIIEQRNVYMTYIVQCGQERAVIHTGKKSIMPGVWRGLYVLRQSDFN